MSTFSRRQKDLLETARTRAKRDPSGVAYQLYRLIEDNTDQERLDTQWAEIWRDIRKGANRAFPASIVRPIEDAIAAIELIDQVLRRLRLNSSDHTVILLGAGVSAPEPSSIPVVGELLPKLLLRARKIGREDLNRLADWCDEQEIKSIEDLLTAAYIADSAARSSSLIALLDYFLFKRRREEDDQEPERSLMIAGSNRRRNTDVDAASIALFQNSFQTLFGLLASTMIPAKPNLAHDAVAQFIKERPGTQIITTNYDGCMDDALLRAGLKPKPLEGTEHEPSSDGHVDLIKLHGSINWFYCDSCQAVKEVPLEKVRASCAPDELSYPVIGVCWECGGQRRPLLVPPLSFKFVMFPDLVNLWSSASQAIGKAKTIIVVGYSFAEADSHINKMISRSLAKSKEQKLIVFDTNPAIVDRLRYRYEAAIEGFDIHRILRAAGNCETLLPELLRSFTNGAKAAPAVQEPSSISAAT
jgi:NAD-dependent SIR2 family protein deacetylase